MEGLGRCWHNAFSGLCGFEGWHAYKVGMGWASRVGERDGLV